MKTEKPKPRGPGRPLEGRAPDGSPEPVSRYPKLTIIMTPQNKAQLMALSAMTEKPIWVLIGEALTAFIDGLPVEDRRAVRGLAKRSRKAEAGR